MNRRAALGASIVLALLASSLVALRRHARPTELRTVRVVPHPRPFAPRPLPPPTPLDTPPSPAPFYMFRGDALHAGRSGFSLPRAPHVRTRIETGARISSQPAVLRNGNLVFGSHDGIIYAADAATGRIIWRRATGDRVYGSPLVLQSSGNVYVGSDADRLFDLSETGAIDVALATDDDADTSVAPAPDGTLRFASGRVLYSTAPDLTVQWRLQFGAKLFSSPAVLADGTTIVGCQDDSVYAVDPTGAIRWHVATGDDVDASPAVDANGRAYIGSDDGWMYCIATTDGAVVWRTHVGGYVRTAAALGLDGSIVVGTYGPRARIVALDRASGAERWSVAIDGPPTADYGIASSALVDRDGRYAIGAPDDALRILSRDGHVDARIEMPAAVDSSPILLSDGVLAVGCDDGGMYVLAD